MKPLVSVVVTTRNNVETIAACLDSIVKQTYKSIELLVVDNYSDDNTYKIAIKYTKHVYKSGPERSAQRNFAVNKSEGKYVLIIDSDMELSENVIYECVTKVTKNSKIGGIIIPEESFGVGFWAKCKHLERSFYVGQKDIEAARFIKKSVYIKLRGYNEKMVGGEDWDFSRRVANISQIEHVDSFIYHNEGNLKFTSTLKKVYYYGQHAAIFFESNSYEKALTSNSGPIKRYKLYLSHPIKLFRNPVNGIGMLLLKTAEYGCGWLGYKNAMAKAKQS